jgi:hypothetical protein
MSKKVGRHFSPDRAATLSIAAGMPFADTCRPDKSAKLKEAHEAAGLKRVLEAAIAEADDTNAVWYDAEEVFAELEDLGWIGGWS